MQLSMLFKTILVVYALFGENGSTKSYGNKPEYTDLRSAYEVYEEEMVNYVEEKPSHLSATCDVQASPKNGCNLEKSTFSSMKKDQRWEYGFDSSNGFNTWPGLCGIGSNQSPVDIPSSMLHKAYDRINGIKNYNSILFDGYDVKIKSGEMTVKNTGRSAKFELLKTNTPIGFRPNYESSDESPQFILVNGHFHWGSADDKGSEHSFGGKKFPLELHLVHYNKRAGQTFEEAVAANQKNSLSVLGVMFEISEMKNVYLEPFFEALDKIKKEGDKVDVQVNNTDEFSLSKFLPANTNDVFQYFGSLTTPNCNEIVHWRLFKEPVFISREQLQAFRKLTFEASSGKAAVLADNFRPIQPLNGRNFL